MIRSLRVLLCIAVLASCALGADDVERCGCHLPLSRSTPSGSTSTTICIRTSRSTISRLAAGAVFGRCRRARWISAPADGPMTDQQIAESKVKVLHVPTVLGAVVPAYNIPGVSAELKFTPDVLADIYLGKITKWNDGRITKVNPGVNFPDQNITVVHRSDGSGTTYIFTDYLSKVSSDWKNSRRQGHFGKVACRYRRQGQRRRGGFDPPVAWLYRLYRTDLRPAE